MTDAEAFDCVAVTFDMDWAPDWCLQECLDLCAEAGVPCTVFVTHRSPLIDALAAGGYPSVELGIHPNFQQPSSHGGTVRDVMAHCLSLVPGATSMRTHGLYQSSQLFFDIGRWYPQIQVDASLLLPYQRGLRPLAWRCDGVELVRVPGYWEDDVAAEDPRWTWESAPPPSDGLKVFDFHPMLTALNMRRLDAYRALKQSLGGKPLHALQPAEVEPFVNRGVGVRDFLARVLRACPASKCVTIRDIARRFGAVCRQAG